MSPTRVLHFPPALEAVVFPPLMDGSIDLLSSFFPPDL